MREAIQLQLTQPCHENWNAMSPTEQGRYCQSCCKTVVDFSILSDREILDYISGHAGADTCARIGDDQLNRTITMPRERKTGWKYFWTMVVGSLLLSYRSLAQVQPPKNKTVNMGVHPGKPGEPVTVRLGGITSMKPEEAPVYELQGQVVDERNRPVPYATVIFGSKATGVAADSNGHFAVPMPGGFGNDLDKEPFVVSAAGYITNNSIGLRPEMIKSIDVQKKQVTIVLGAIELKQNVLKEAVVTVSAKTYVSGGLGYSIILTRTNKLVDSISNLVSKDIRTYPNPAPAGSSVNMQFNLKETGEYKILLLDASGKVVSGRQLTLEQKGQVETLAVPQAHGAYFIRVAGRNGGKVYSTKLVVQ